MARRLIAVLLIFLLALSIAACSIQKKDKGTSGSNQTSTTGTNALKDETTDTTGGDKDTSEPAGSDQSGSAADESGAKEAMETGLSMGYRTDIVPVYKDSKVTRSWEDHSIPESPTYIISCRSYSPYEEVAKYYKDIISGLTILQVYIDSEDSYHVDAAINDQGEVSVRVDKERYEEYSEGAKCNVTLMYRKPKKAELPEGYRTDLLPVMEGSSLKTSAVRDKGYDGIEYTAQFLTTKGYEEVVEFYKAITKSLDQHIEPERSIIQGTVDKVWIYLDIEKLPEGTKYSVMMIDRSKVGLD